MKRRFILACVFIAWCAHDVSAAVIAAHGPGTVNWFPGGNTAGQSITTSSGGPWNNITFNWFADNAGTPTAFGALYLLSEEYFGSADNLSSAVSGFIAASTGIVDDLYVFDQMITLSPSTQYFVYADTEGFLTQQAPGTYLGGTMYVAPMSTDNFFIPPSQDAAFSLSGTVVPEPSRFLLLTTGVAWSLFSRRRRKAEP